MLGEGGTALSEFQAAARKFLARDERDVDLKDYRAVIDSLEGDFSSVARDKQRSGAHLVGGNITAASWIARTCDMSVTSAADRLCVGEQLESLPKVAAALASGEIGYQSVSILCHLRDVLGEARALRRGRDAGLRARILGVPLCAGCAATPDISLTQMASSMRRKRTSPGAGCTSARWPTACTRSMACSTR